MIPPPLPPTPPPRASPPTTPPTRCAIARVCRRREQFRESADFPLAILSSEPSFSPLSPPERTSLSWHRPHQTSFSKGSSHRNTTTPTKTEPTTTRTSTDGGVQSRRRVSDTTIKLDLWERGGGACANNDDDDYDERTGAKNTQQRNRGGGATKPSTGTMKLSSRSLRLSPQHNNQLKMMTRKGDEGDSFPTTMGRREGGGGKGGGSRQKTTMTTSLL